MSDISFPCPHCGQHIAIDESASGAQVKCPTCQGDLVVPQRSPRQLAGRVRALSLLVAAVVSTLLAASAIWWFTSGKSRRSVDAPVARNFTAPPKVPLVSTGEPPEMQSASAVEEKAPPPKATSSEPDPKVLAELMPQFGHVRGSLIPLNTAAGQIDHELFALSLRDSKLSLLQKEKLGLDYDLPMGTASNTFSHLPEVVQIIASWQKQPSHIDYYPEQFPPLSKVKQLLGAPERTEQTEERTDLESSAKVSVDWHVYGRWRFGAADGTVRLIRTCFSSSAAEHQEQNAKTSPSL